MFSLLRDKRFRLLWLGQICSQSGDRLTQLVLVALVATRSAGSTLTLAKVLAATSLPGLLVSPFAGVYVDRWDRKKTMIICDLIRAGLILVLPWLVLRGNVLPLYGAVFGLFSVACFFVPARLSMIPDVVPAGQLARANALFTSSGMIGSTLILLLGGLLVEAIGASKSCLVTSASYLLSAVFITPIVRQKKISSSGSRATTGKIFREVGEGIRELWRHPSTRRVAGLLFILMAGAGASMVVSTVLVQQLLGTLTRDLGFLSLWVGVGMLVGSIVYGRWGIKKSRKHVLGVSFFGCGVAFWFFVGAVMGLRSGVAASAAAALLGFWIAPVGIVANTLVHEAHPERLHGRIFSSLGVVVNLSLIGSMLIAGWLTEAGGRGLFLSVLGGIFVLGGIVLARRRA